MVSDRSHTTFLKENMKSMQRKFEMKGFIHNGYIITQIGIPHMLVMFLSYAPICAHDFAKYILYYYIIGVFIVKCTRLFQLNTNQSNSCQNLILF
jgi:hypothetical protein